MSGIYIHIPFCKQACHYCDFHFSTTLKKKSEMITAICRELTMRKEELNGEVETIYFGGGTPSLLTSEELTTIFDCIYQNYKIIDDPEITLEANPDDLSEITIAQLAVSPINRLSIGVQSFFKDDLQLMNRAHTSKEAEQCIKNARKYFDNISIDLIYGIPGLSSVRWKENLRKAISFGIPHLSCYALTVEPRTALASFIKKGKVGDVDDDVSAKHYQILLELLEKEGYDNYEFSNFGKVDNYSRNNTAYWQGKTYIGIGPSAHSFNGRMRSWNISNNSKYINSIGSGTLPSEMETLTQTDKYNEYVMTGLRTKWGISLNKIEDLYGSEYREYLMLQAGELLKEKLLIEEDETLRVTKKGKYFSDGIASSLFLVNLD